MLQKLTCVLLLLVADIAVLWATSSWVRWPTMSEVWMADTHAFGAMVHGWRSILPMVVLLILLMAREGLYVRRLPFQAEVRHLLLAVVYGFILTYTFSGLGLLPEVLPTRMAWGMLGGLIGLAGGRRAMKRLLYGLGFWRKPVFLVGAGATGRRLAEAFAQDHFTGFDVVAALDDDPSLQGSTVGGQASVVGTLDDLDDRLPQVGAAGGLDLWIAIPRLSRDRLLHIINQAEGRVESIRFVPDLLGLSMVGVELENVRGTLAIRLKQNLLKPWNQWAKRLLDLLLALLLALLMMPVAIGVGLLVALESSGHPLLTQERLGLRGSRFRCWKFRTMYLDADTRLEAALSTDTSLREEWTQYAKLKGRDPRVTPLGRWLRRFSLDELPQLWNILRGEMSLIGPRPYLLRERERIGEFLPVIGAARPGLTGLWQVSGRNELSFEERVILDEHYVRNWTLALDLWILLKTAWVTISGRGAY